MVGEKAIFIAPRAKFEVVRGLIPAELLAFYSSHEIAGETERKVLSIAENRACTMYIRNPDHAFLGLLLGSVKEGDELLTEIKKLRGIRAAYLDLTTEYIELYEVFKDRIDELAAQVSSRRRAVTCG